MSFLRVASRIFHTHVYVEEVFCAFRKQLLVCSTQWRWLQDIAGAIVTLEHSVVDHVPKIYATRGK